MRRSNLETWRWAAMMCGLLLFALSCAAPGREGPFNTEIFKYLGKMGRTRVTGKLWDGRFDISGMARLDETRFVVVHDAKGEMSRPRIGMISPTTAGVEYTALSARPRRTADSMSDLEAMSEIPSRPGEFLVAESGYQGNRFGRVFRMRLERGKRAPTLAIEQVFSWPEGTVDIEGIAFSGTPSSGTLLAARRDGVLYTARLVFDDRETKLSFDRTIQLPKAFPTGWRELADLCIEGTNLWAIAAFEGIEEGTSIGFGPFKSAVYRLGSLDSKGNLQIAPAEQREVRWLEGFKAEAISLTDFPGSPLAVGTDDESFGGAWRLVERW